jgi:hypothetical protein
MLEVVMGHPGLGAPGQVSLHEAMSMTFSTLHQVRDVLHREREDLEVEQLWLKEWGPC